jgi:predicted DNA-binding protein
MISIKLPKKAQAILQKMAQESGQTENEIAFEALMERIEDWHDAQIIAERMKDDDGVTIPLEDLLRELDAADVSKNHAAE